MEIIHTYKSSDETEICVISDGRSIHLADKADLTVESPKVGTVLKPSEMTEVYLEIPIPVLQEAARRSEIFVEPDVEEEEASDEEGEEEEEEEEEALAPWEPLAKEQFFEEYKALDEGVDIRVLVNFPVKVRYEEGETASWNTTDGAYSLEEMMGNQEGLRNAIESINQRIQNLHASLARFTQEQIALGHELEEHTVDEHLNDELEKLKAEDVANAAE